jgi:hypothetical protein
MKNNYLRYLDIDDLIILTSLLQGQRLGQIAISLKLTPPALSHRIKKYRTFIPNFTLDSGSRGNWRKIDFYSLTDDTKQICIKAKQALGILSGQDAA